MLHEIPKNACFFNSYLDIFGGANVSGKLYVPLDMWRLYWIKICVAFVCGKFSEILLNVSQTCLVKCFKKYTQNFFKKAVIWRSILRVFPHKGSFLTHKALQTSKNYRLSNVFSLCTNFFPVYIFLQKLFPEDIEIFLCPWTILWSRMLW